MRLLGNRLLVERVKRPTNHDSLIVLPPILQDDDNTGGPKEFGVVDVGPGRTNSKGILLPVECAPGDRVICHSYTTGITEIGPNRFIITDDMIIAVIPKEQ